MARAKDADPAATHDAIVAAALELLAEVDHPSQLSMRRVAQRAELSLGTVQYYFASKDALVEACLDGYHDRMGVLGQALIAKAMDPGSDRDGFIAHAVREMYRFIRRERAAVGLRMAATVAQGELAPERQEELLGAFIAAAAAALAPFAKVSEFDARLSIQAMATMMVRFARLSDGEVASLTGLEPAEGRAAIEDYCVRAGCRLVGAPIDA